jgi:hypothetical protein
MNVTDVFDDDGILVGWLAEHAKRDGNSVEMFIPRRDEDIEADRAAITRLLESQRRSPRTTSQYRKRWR